MGSFGDAQNNAVGAMRTMESNALPKIISFSSPKVYSGGSLGTLREADEDQSEQKYKGGELLPVLHRSSRMGSSRSLDGCGAVDLKAPTGSAATSVEEGRANMPFCSRRRIDVDSTRTFRKGTRSERDEHNWQGRKNENGLRGKSVSISYLQ